MNAYDVLIEHHELLHHLGEQMLAASPGTTARQACIDRLLLEFDIHMRIEDDIYYPALTAAGDLIAIAHAEHRQIYDQLAVALRTPPESPDYQDEWQSFMTVLLAHATEEERDLIPPPLPIHFTDDQLERLGLEMTMRMERLRTSPFEKLHVRARAMLLRAF
ncbi:hypothetical protein A5740_12885 [Mycobacterium sp. GA-1841]|uniref:hemerythrin domain-containing protein n=1 Tax=Mycobacterium sp. GA-1841 TaxID=1834154 RepID=UPI00096C4E45|nr:hemerythrin domain-containing protein [Mycobacterium sp. GA-1841]OMC32568.1 hypothetical protein A5740_12885 [Mycobacterium sp. GA-1841]